MVINYNYYKHKDFVISSFYFLLFLFCYFIVYYNYYISYFLYCDFSKIYYAMNLTRRLEFFYFFSIDNYVQYMNSYTSLIKILKSKIPLNIQTTFMPPHEYLQFKRFMHSNKNLHNLKFELNLNDKFLFSILDSVSRYFEKVKFVHSKFELGSINSFQKSLMNNYILLDTFYYNNKMFWYHKNLNYKPLYYNFKTLLEGRVLNDVIQAMYPKFLSSDNTFKFFYNLEEEMPKALLNKHYNHTTMDVKSKLIVLTKADPFNVSEIYGFKLRRIVLSERHTYYLSLFEKRFNFWKVNII